MAISSLISTGSNLSAAWKINETIDQVNTNTTNLSAHTSASNPHNITASTINAVTTSQKGASSGVATLDSYVKVTPAQTSARVVNVTASQYLRNSDYGAILKCTGSTTITITITSEGSAGSYPSDFETEIIRYGTGAVTISPASGVTLNSKDNARSIASQYGAVSLKKMGANEWWMVGDLE